MATQKYMPRGDTTPPGEAQNDATHPVHGDQRKAELGLNKSGASGPVKTPPPEREYDPRVKDHSWGRASGNPGSNGWGGSSSIHPGETTADVALAAQPQPDTALEVVKSKSQKLIEHDGSGPNRMLTNSQLRDITDKRDGNRDQVPIHSDTSGAKRGPMITDTITPNPGDYGARKPGK